MHAQAIPLFGGRPAGRAGSQARRRIDQTSAETLVMIAAKPTNADSVSVIIIVSLMPRSLFPICTHLSSRNTYNAYG